MTAPKTNLRELTRQNLHRRIDSANKGIYMMREELARRDKIAKYKTEMPELSVYFIDVIARFSLTISAKSEDDAYALVEKTTWLEWYDSPGDQISIFEYDIICDEVEVEVTAPPTIDGIAPSEFPGRGDTIH